MADAKILATIERSDTEQLQISVSEYKGSNNSVSVSVNKSTNGYIKEKKCVKKEQNDKVSNNTEITMLDDVLDEELGFLRATNTTKEK